MSACAPLLRSLISGYCLQIFFAVLGTSWKCHDHLHLIHVALGALRGTPSSTCESYFCSYNLKLKTIVPTFEWCKTLSHSYKKGIPSEFKQPMTGIVCYRYSGMGLYQVTQNFDCVKTKGGFKANCVQELKRASCIFLLIQLARLSTSCLWEARSCRSLWCFEQGWKYHCKSWLMFTNWSCKGEREKYH